MGEGAEDDLDAFIAVVAPIPSRGADALRAKVREAVAFVIEPTCLWPGLLGVEQVAVLRHHQEDQAVHEFAELR